MKSTGRRSFCSGKARTGSGALFRPRSLLWFSSARNGKLIIPLEKTFEEMLTGRDGRGAAPLVVAASLGRAGVSEAAQGRRVNPAQAAVKPLSVTVIPRSCRSTGVLHSSGSASADYPQYTEGISSPLRAFCRFLPLDTFRVNRRKPEDLPGTATQVRTPPMKATCKLGSQEAKGR